MDLTNITSAQFNQIAKLLQKKESLQTQIAAINEELSAIEGRSPAPAAKAARGGKRTMSAAGRAAIAAAQKARWAKINAGKPTKAETAAKTGRKGGVADKIVAALQEAGPEGMTVPQIADKLGMKVANVRAWVYTTGKKLVKAVKRGVFASKDMSAVQAQQATAEAPASKKRKMSAAGRAAIAAAARARWAKVNAEKA